MDGASSQRVGLGGLSPEAVVFGGADKVVRQVVEVAVLDGLDDASEVVVDMLDHPAEGVGDPRLPSGVVVGVDRLSVVGRAGVVRVDHDPLLPAGGVVVVSRLEACVADLVIHPTLLVVNGLRRRQDGRMGIGQFGVGGLEEAGVGPIVAQADQRRQAFDPQGLDDASEVVVNGLGGPQVGVGGEPSPGSEVRGGGAVINDVCGCVRGGRVRW